MCLPVLPTTESQALSIGVFGHWVLGDWLVRGHRNIQFVSSQIGIGDLHVSNNYPLFRNFSFLKRVACSNSPSVKESLHCLFLHTFKLLV